MRRPIIYAIGVAMALGLWLPNIANAHGFGERYDLPVPLELYVLGAGATVVLSFAFMGLFTRGGFGSSYPRWNLLSWKIGRAIAHPTVLQLVKVSSAAVFGIYLFAGLFGTEDPNGNLVPTLTWVVFWVGLAYVSALVGDLWALINPWKILYSYAESIVFKLNASHLSRYEPYPETIGSWPAVVLFFMFAWVEVAYTRSGVPFNIVMLVLAYSAITFAGMWLFGRDEWLRNGEVFTIAFGFFAAFAPTELRVRPGGDGDDLVNNYEAFSIADPSEREWNIRPWGVGLLSVSRLSLSQVSLLVLILTTVSFDGFVETGPWKRALVDWHSVFNVFGSSSFTIMTTLGLLVAPMLCFGLFAIISVLMGRLVDIETSAIGLMRTFAISFIPIALAYHIAHFFSFLMVQGQRIFALISDPFGWGWNLFGTAGTEIDIGIVNARFIWILSVGVIVIGHIAAIYIAHVCAVRAFRGKGQAVRSQYPMLVLMVGYTMASLWIVAQPITTA